MTPASRPLITRTDLRLAPDPSRVLARLFVPGQELARDRESRASGVLHRVLALPEESVAITVGSVAARYAGRHRDIRTILQSHYEQVAHRVTGGVTLSDDRRLLIGACFTNEYSVEAAALFNPSVVAHPDQTGLEPGAVRFVLSLRAVGEGHISSLEFRTGVVGPGHKLRVDAPGRFLDAGAHHPTTYDRELFRSRLAQEGPDGENSSFLLGRLSRHFDHQALEAALAALAGQRITRRGGARTAELARRIAACNYEVDFDAESPLSERILAPHAPSESHGIEDARFVRFAADDNRVTYYATYTAFDGDQIAPQLIETVDFQYFRISQLSGPAAANKGMALFPRKVHGRYVALSRWDRESNAIATSADGLAWGSPTTLYAPEQPWELIQLGNAGSPIETTSGWLVLTHAVGPMREYSLGAMLLDLDDPSHVLGSLREPLMRPQRDERDGYVPNVVYSCGALRYGDQLLLPYGVSDSSIRFAFVDLPALLDRLGSYGAAATTRANRSA